MAGRSLASTTASTKAGRDERRADWIAGLTSSARSQRNASAPQALAKSHEVDRRQIAAVRRVATLLLEAYSCQAVVLEQDNLNRRMLRDRSRQLGHQHREAAVSDDGRSTVGRDKRAGRQWGREVPAPCSPACRCLSGAGFPAGARHRTHSADEWGLALGADAHPEPAGMVGKARDHEGRCFLMPNANIANPVLPLARLRSPR